VNCHMALQEVVQVVMRGIFMASSEAYYRSDMEKTETHQPTTSNVSLRLASNLVTYWVVTGRLEGHVSSVRMSCLIRSELRFASTNAR
jgi:hypothetical protein